VLTVQQIRAEVAKLRYRPGWFFAVEERGFEDPWLRMLATGVMNAYDPQSTIDLGIDSPIPPMANTDQLYRWLMWRLERVESHEAREWFRIDGAVLFDPHRPRDRV
jgi:hypothetical protein